MKIITITRIGYFLLLLSIIFLLASNSDAITKPVFAASVTSTDISNPDNYSCGQPGFINFENFSDGTNLSASTINGLHFTTTNGYTWLVGDFSTRHYNGKYPNGGYTSDGTHWAWLGPNQGAGRIDIINGTASVFSLLTSNDTPVQLDAYDSANNLLATAGPAPFTFNTGHMNELKITRDTADISYLIVHDTGNFFLVDDICTNGPGIPYQTLPKVHAQVLEAVTGQATYVNTPTVAVFSDPDPFASSSSYTITIDWGDFSGLSNGTVSAVDWKTYCKPWELNSSATNCYAITSSNEHIYQSPGIYEPIINVEKINNNTIATQGISEIVSPANRPNPPFFSHTPGSDPSTSIGVVTFLYNDNTVLSCTATALANVNIVLTAQHCYHADGGISQIKNIQFAPGHKAEGGTAGSKGQCFKNQQLSDCGSNPLGYWEAKGSDIYEEPNGADAGFIVMKGLGGNNNNHLLDALSSASGFPGLPVTFFLNGSSQNWAIFGYPTGYSSGFVNGQSDWRLHHCGPNQGDVSSDGTVFILQNCDTLGVDPSIVPSGASGGPWVSNDILPYGVGATVYTFCPAGSNCYQFSNISSDDETGAPLYTESMKAYMQAVFASQN